MTFAAAMRRIAREASAPWWWEPLGLGLWFMALMFLCQAVLDGDPYNQVNFGGLVALGVVYACVGDRDTPQQHFVAMHTLSALALCACIWRIW